VQKLSTINAFLGNSSEGLIGSNMPIREFSKSGKAKKKKIQLRKADLTKNHLINKEDT